MNIEFLEQDNDDIACISCIHRCNKNESSYCDIDQHYMHYADMWTNTCDRHELAQRYYSGEYVKFNYTDDLNITHQKYGRIHRVVDNGLFVVFWNNDVDGYLYEKILNSQIISQERPSVEISDDVFERTCEITKET